jgi:hypothetical protein
LSASLRLCVCFVVPIFGACGSGQNAGGFDAASTPSPDASISAADAARPAEDAGPDGGVDAGSASSPPDAAFSQFNRPPYNWYPYPKDSLWLQQLPPDITAHDIVPANYGLSASSAAAMVNCALTGCGVYSLADEYGAMRSFVSSVASDGTTGIEDQGSPIYYSQPTDPYYWIHGSDCVWDPFVDFRVQIPNQAARTGRSIVLPNGSDGAISFFDQTQGVFGGMAGSGCPTCVAHLPACSASTPETACDLLGTGAEGSACSAERPYADKDWGWTANTHYDWTSPSGVVDALGGAGDNIVQGAHGSMGLIRIEEFGVDVDGLVGRILHAGSSTIGCVTGQVFPATSGAYPCSSVSGMSSADVNNFPPNGALFYCDYTNEQIAAMQLPPWQNTVLTWLCRYGTYPSVTDGGDHGVWPIAADNVESELAYFRATGHHHPVYAWMQGQKLGSPTCNGTNCPAQITMTGNGFVKPHSEYRFSYNMLYGIPPVNGDAPSNTEAYLLKHFHIADPCIVKRMVNNVGGNVAGACP